MASSIEALTVEYTEDGVTTAEECSPASYTIRRIICSLGFIFLMSMGTAFAFENLFYTTGESLENINGIQVAYADFQQHSDHVQVIAPQAYYLDGNGLLYGFENPQLIQYAKTHHVKILALVTNSKISPITKHVIFDKDTLDQLLHNPAAMKRAIANLLSTVKNSGFSGIQVDFELIPMADRDLFTQFFHQLAAVFHKNHLIASVAVMVPNEDSALGVATNGIHSTPYDYKALADASDFISVMAYDQHTVLSLPGPVAGDAFVRKTVIDLLPVIPAKKFSLGMPVYSDYWETTYKGKLVATQISYAETQYLADVYGAKWRWDKNANVAYSIFHPGSIGQNQYIYLENARSFSIKLALIKQYHLRGISVWKLGLEDPAIWKLLK